MSERESRFACFFKVSLSLPGGGCLRIKNQRIFSKPKDPWRRSLSEKDPLERKSLKQNYRSRVIL